MNQSPQEKILQSIETIKFLGIALLHPKVVKREGVEFLYSSTFFEFASDPKVALPEQKVLACDPLGTAIYCHSPSKTKGVLSGLSSFAAAANALNVDYDWVRGFNVGYGCGVVWTYVPKPDFNLATHFNLEAFEFGFGIEV